MSVAQTRNCKQKSIEKQFRFLLNSGFSTGKKFQRKQLLTVLHPEIFLPWKIIFYENCVRRGAYRLCKKNLNVQNKVRARFYSNLVQKTLANKLVLFD